MDISQYKELLLDALQNKLSTVVIDAKEHTPVSLFVQLYNTSLQPGYSGQLSSDEASKLAFLIGDSAPLDGREIMRLAFIPDELGERIIRASSEAGHPFVGDKISSAIGGLISKGRLNTALTVVSLAKDQNLDITNSQLSYNTPFARCADNIKSKSSDALQAEMQHTLVRLMKELPWDISAQVLNRTLPEYFQSANLPICYDFASREMANTIKEQASLHTEEAQQNAGMNANLRGSL